MVGCGGLEVFAGSNCGRQRDGGREQARPYRERRVVVVQTGRGCAASATSHVLGVVIAPLSDGVLAAASWIILLLAVGSSGAGRVRRAGVTAAWVLSSNRAI